MRRYIYNFVLREPQKLDVTNIEPYFISGKYETLTFFSDIENQTIFNGLLSGKQIGDISKTELYINGVRYNPGEDYNILEDGTLIWLNEVGLDVGWRCVIVYR
tara:strand:+ start:73 stop:381 length:309 start_codon:yes stop_codon:yes gene_type:complete